MTIRMPTFSATERKHSSQATYRKRTSCECKTGKKSRTFFHNEEPSLAVDNKLCFGFIYMHNCAHFLSI